MVTARRAFASGALRVSRVALVDSDHTTGWTTMDAVFKVAE
jgi:hypothetical protein